MNTKVYFADERDKMITFKTNAAVKHVFIDEKLYKHLPL